MSSDSESDSSTDSYHSSARKKFKYDWDSVARKTAQRQLEHGVKKIPPKFVAEPTTLAWLQKFATKRTSDRVEIRIEDIFPWLSNPDWDSLVDLEDAGVKQVKQALRQAEDMESSLDTFLSCVKDRLGRLRRTLKDIAIKSYFPLLSDDVLAMIFEFAAMPLSQATGDVYDNKTPSNIARVSRRFRAVALKLPRLWRYIDITSDVKAISTRSSVAGPILEVFVRSTKSIEENEREERNLELYSFLGRIAPLSSRITFLRLDLSPATEEKFFKKLQNAKKLASLSFPFLHELELNYTKVQTDLRNIHFYRGWKIPSLKVMKARNVIPEFRSESVLEEITDFHLTLDEERRGAWKFEGIMKLLSSLSSVKLLDLFLHGEVVSKRFNCNEQVSLPTVERLKTAFPEMLIDTAQSFCQRLETPFKMHWILEIHIEEEMSSWYSSRIDQFFTAGSFKYLRGYNGYNMLSSRLKEMDIIFRNDFVKDDCDTLTAVSQEIPNLERLTVTYETVTKQLRRFELKDCKGKVERMMEGLKEGFEERLGVENPHFVIEGSEVEA
ncbi:hypothetical protein SCHPADRAFT_1003129 [Schizopora paradoxa]|uniref:F-box domain-containing protein n=1 Tax=Schizopora paradoxa TaxID=27342 RepID=A0A0H2QZX3_9AGAM|nr:hypothetical protein SCHPADRAFT_1003129 [Schizopora paradoxa]